MSDDALDFLMQKSVPTANFLTVGVVRKGRIRAYEKTQQTDIKGNRLTWDDGNPRWQLVFTIETNDRDPEIDNDDGVRKIYAKGQMLEAIREAVKASGHRGALVGGYLAVKYDSDGQPSQPGFNPPKQYLVQFKAPEQTEDLFDAPSEPEPEPDYPIDEEPF